MTSRRALLALSAALFGLLVPPAVARAQPGMILTIGSAAVPLGLSEEIPLSLENLTGDAVAGLSLGLCFDVLNLQPDGAVPGDAIAALVGPAGPGLFVYNPTPGGVELALLIDFFGAITLPPGPTSEVVRFAFVPIGPPLWTEPLTICGTLGTNVSVVVASGIAFTPGTVDGWIEILDPPPASLGLAATAPAIPFGAVDVSVLADLQGGLEEVQFGVAHDAQQLTPIAVVIGTNLAAVNGGTGPDLFLVDLAPSGGEGWTVSVVVSDRAPFDVVPAGSDRELAIVTYEVLPQAGPACGSTSLAFTDLLGSPPVPLRGRISGIDFEPLSAGLDLPIGTFVAPLPSGGSMLRAPGLAIDPLPGIGIASFRLDTPTAVEGFSFGVRHDGGVASVLAVEPGVSVRQLECSIGADFFGATLDPQGEAGFTVGCLFALAPPARTIPAGDGHEIVRATYQWAAAGGATTPLEFAADLGSPPVAIELSVAGTAIVPGTVDGFLQVAHDFTRGDCNVDGGVDIADAITILALLFPGPGGAVPPDCADACDGNDDGQSDIADSIFLLGALFVPGAPQPPGGPCSSDPTPFELLGCDSFDACP
jgi:hypothetical protein